MKLNNELIRDILIYIEDVTDGVKPVYKEIKIEGYTQSEIIYHLRLLTDGGYVSQCQATIGNPICFKGLTWKGHEYLESIRDRYIWQEVKRNVENSGIKNTTLDIIQKLADKIVREKLGL